MASYTRLVIASIFHHFNTLRPRQNGRHFPDDFFKWIFLNENLWISIKISLKFVPRGPINNIPALIQIMAWRRTGDKPLSEPMMYSLLVHMYVTQPQWVNCLFLVKYSSNATFCKPVLATFFNKAQWVKQRISVYIYGYICYLLLAWYGPLLIVTVRG